MILFAFNLEKYVKIGVIKMVFVPTGYAIVIQDFQEKIAQKQFVRLINFIYLLLVYAVLLVFQELIKIYIQDLVFLVLRLAVSALDIQMHVLLVNHL
jgi:hypothetical protein